MHSQGEKREIIMNNAINNSITGGVYGMAWFRDKTRERYETCN